MSAINACTEKFIVSRKVFFNLSMDDFVVEMMVLKCLLNPVLIPVSDVDIEFCTLFMPEVIVLSISLMEVFVVERRSVHSADIPVFNSFALSRASVVHESELVPIETPISANSASVIPASSAQSPPTPERISAEEAAAFASAETMF